MRIRKIALILGVAAAALCGCGDKTKTLENTEVQSEKEELIGDNSESVFAGDTQADSEEEVSTADYDEIISNVEI